MKKADHIKRVVKFLEGHGYILHATSPKRGVDLIVFQRDNPNMAIFVAVMPLKARSFPMQPFKGKHGQSRFLSLMSGACKWIGEVEWKGNIRFDSVIVHDTNGMIDHIEDAGRKGLR